MLVNGCWFQAIVWISLEWHRVATPVYTVGLCNFFLRMSKIVVALSGGGVKE